jgi:hypothetical protein
MVQQSLMNDEKLRDFGVLAITEPHVRKQGDTLIIVPMGHSNWTRMIPTVQEEGLWAVRSMLWVHKDLEAEQVAVASSGLTAAVLRLPDRAVLVVSVYVPGNDAEALLRIVGLLRSAINDVRNKIGTRTDVVLAGDFNRHDCLWGGDDISLARQGEADPIIDLMSEHALLSLLPRGTKTWQNGDRESTIDLMLASEELAATVLSCQIHETEHGSDHRAIETEFDVALPERHIEPRLLWKNAPWGQIRERIDLGLRDTPREGNTQEQADRLMAVVQEAVIALTPKAKPSPYAKRWWTKDLTHLRRTYTYWRNQARTHRRAGGVTPELELQAREASKEYHDAIRKQKKAHWDAFLADDINIWQAARYMNPGANPAFEKIPPLIKGDDSATEGKTEQAAELLKTFFPPLPAVIEDEGERPQRAPVEMPRLTLEETERRVFAAKPWKAPGDDGLPAEVWKQIWPVAKDRVLRLFQTSLDEGILPAQWRNAKIIPLRKPDKPNYKLAKAYRPISLLATLGKILESIVADRISYIVEEIGLLPANHFGARKKRSTEQALTLLQEYIYKAWRSKKVLSLISFDMKGAYNGVYKERLLQRLRARGIPQVLVQWIDAFCSRRTATILVNGYTSEKQDLPQAGLPQGSPLSPILFLFFNADLVQHKLNTKGGSMAFVDDYTAWVTGPSAEANRGSIEAIVARALEWERRSGATFEGDKTSLVHFTRDPRRTDMVPVMVKGKPVVPRSNAKILGVIMDPELRFKEHIANAATKGLNAAMALKRLRMTSPSTARQLFGATVAPVVDYASNIWSHACKSSAMPALNRVQRIGAQAITGVFRTVATAIGEAEASIPTVLRRHQGKAAAFWVGLRTLPPTNPVTKLHTGRYKRFISPLQRIAWAFHRTPVTAMECIQPHIMAPWEARIRVQIESQELPIPEGIQIATSSSVRNGLVGLGGTVRDTTAEVLDRPVSYSITLGPKTEQNSYTAELAAMAMAVTCPPVPLHNRTITLLTSNQAALLAINHPQQQSGQGSIKQIYNGVRALRDRGNIVRGQWVPTQRDLEISGLAKRAAKKSTELRKTPDKQSRQAKTTILHEMRRRIKAKGALPEGIGKQSKDVDAALPGKHTKTIYDTLNKKEAGILSQLRTGMARINNYLYRIGASGTDQCDCGTAKETVKHFLFLCTRWDHLRAHLLQQAGVRIGDISFCLGGRSKNIELDPTPWEPNMNAVRAAIRYAMATERLLAEEQAPP